MQNFSKIGLTISVWNSFASPAFFRAISTRGVVFQQCNLMGVEQTEYEHLHRAGYDIEDDADNEQTDVYGSFEISCRPLFLV